VLAYYFWDFSFFRFGVETEVGRHPRCSASDSTAITSVICCAYECAEVNRGLRLSSSVVGGKATPANCVRR
jgi:hypothetical protein